MTRAWTSGVFLCVVGVLIGTNASAQPEKVDFRRDVLPILRQNCVGCHGPSKQMNSLRLDRRSRTLRGGTQTVLVPGNSASSRLYHRLIGNKFGNPMPPSGPLPADQIETIKTWIDQGAEWPDDLANESEPAPIDPSATHLIDLLRAADLAAFNEAVAAKPALVNARGIDGSTPFMYAAIYGDAALLKQLLAKGADPNAHNDANATALIYAASSLEKTKVLVDAGADVNARTDDGRTPLFIAAGIPGNIATVRLLLERGATVNPTSRSFADSTPLRSAIEAPDYEIAKLLVDRGADIKAAGFLALASAAAVCPKCLDLMAAGDPKAYSQALVISAANGDTPAIKLLLDRGADVNATDPNGSTALIFATAADHAPLDVVTLLLERGAKLDQKTEFGLTALDYAKLHGDTPVVDLLVKAGARDTGAWKPATVTFVKNNTIQAAVERSLPILQKADVNFMQKTGCISCHNDSFTAMSVAAARKAGFSVDETLASRAVQLNLTISDALRERMLQGIAPGGPLPGPAIQAYVLMGLAAEQHKSDVVTDALARFIHLRQSPDGHWPAMTPTPRPPLTASAIIQTAVSARALQLYAPAMARSEYDAAARRAGAWLTTARAQDASDRAYRLMGLAWTKSDKAALRSAMKDVVAAQRADGGWSDLATLPSGAFATAQALVALQEAGMPTNDRIYQRGVRFLLDTQLEDGSWYVKSRSAPLQPYFDNGFPHKTDQWISAAATNWATMALARAASTTTPRPTVAGVPGRE
jgi:ankyrin repeat protein